MPSGTSTRRTAPAGVELRSLVRIGPRKLATLVGYGATVLVLWLVTGDPVLVTVYATAAAVVVLATFVLLVRRRAERRQPPPTSTERPSPPADGQPPERSAPPASPVRSASRDISALTEELAELEARFAKSRRFPRMEPHARNLDMARELLGLDQEAAAAADHPDGAPIRIERTPMAIGLGSLFLNRLHLHFADGTSRQLVEKGTLRHESHEPGFWLDPDLGRRQLSGDTFECLPPSSVLTAGPIAVLYLPYRPELDHGREQANDNFRDNLDAITVAAAHLNASNLISSSPSAVTHPFLPRWRRPSVREVDQLVDPGNENVARALVHLWREVQGGVEEVLERYAELPSYLCHHDIGAGNAVHVDGRTTFLDLAFVGQGPLGSDMHSVIRTSGSLTDLDRVDELLRLYTEAVRELGIRVDVEDVKLAAWTSYYLRYSSVRWRSARDPDAFSLALVKMGELIRG